MLVAGKVACSCEVENGQDTAAKLRPDAAVCILQLKSASPCTLTSLHTLHTCNYLIIRRIFEGAPPYGILKLNSQFFELGEVSFMKETIASQVCVRVCVLFERCAWFGAI